MSLSRYLQQPPKIEPTTVYPQVSLVSRSLLLTSLRLTSLNIPQLPKFQSFEHEPRFPLRSTVPGSFMTEARLLPEFQNHVHLPC